jgi:Ca2+-binding EF-hand superfamily protein
MKDKKNDSKKNIIDENFLEKYNQLGLNSDEVYQIKDAFDFLDKDGSGAVSKQELEQAKELLMEGENENENQEENIEQHMDIFTDLLSKMDSKKSNQIVFEDFIELFVNEQQRNPTKYYADLFVSFAQERSNAKQLSFDELKLIVKEIQEDIPDQELRQMFNRADLDKDGFVGKEEFVKFMTSN